MSIAFGQKNADLTRTLHRRACQMALILAITVVLGMLTVGPWFLSHWTGGHVPPSRGLLSILLLVVVFYSLWSTSSTLLQAINQHERLAAVYTFATGITCVICYLAARRFGLYGAAASLLVSEAVMNLYVLPASLKIADDRLGDFLASMAHWPKSLSWEAMASRLRRSKPGLES
jgi:O-antigen/teichoic acid export membrane protein